MDLPVGPIMTDYDLDIALIGVFYHRKEHGTNRGPVGQFAQEIADQFDAIIRARTNDLTLDAKQRTVLAVLASMASGPTPIACVDVAVQEFRALNR
jgi:hypothetical protein